MVFANNYYGFCKIFISPFIHAFLKLENNRLFTFSASQVPCGIMVTMSECQNVNQWSILNVVRFCNEFCKWKNSECILPILCSKRVTVGKVFVFMCVKIHNCVRYYAMIDIYSIIQRKKYFFYIDISRYFRIHILI